MTTTTLKVQGMSCEHCAHAVTSALQSIDGVRTARVDLQAGRAVIEYDESRADVARMVAAVVDEGYTAEAMS